MEANERPFAADADWKPVVFNDGAFQRTVKPEDFEEIRACKGLDENRALEQIQPEDLAPCYPYVRAVEQGNRVQAALVWWVQEPGRPGSAKAECPFRCSPQVACQDPNRVKGQCALPVDDRVP